MINHPREHFVIFQRNNNKTLHIRYYFEKQAPAIQRVIAFEIFSPFLRIETKRRKNILQYRYRV